MEKGDGEVRIFPLTSTNDPDLGYQHFTTSHELRDRKYLPMEDTYFTIDLNNKETAEYILEHIVHIMLTFETAFVIKDKTGTKDDGNMICAFDLFGFLRRDEIYSGDSSSNQMTISGYSTDFYDKNVFEEYDIWDDLWEYKMGLTHKGRNAEFLIFYFNQIKTGISDQAKEIRKILSLDDSGNRV